MIDNDRAVRDAEAVVRMAAWEATPAEDRTVRATDDARPTEGDELTEHFACIQGDPDQRVELLVATAGDEYAAMLVATSELASTLLRGVYSEVQRGTGRAADLEFGRKCREGAQADVANYYGDTLARQAPRVVRAAGIEV